MVGRTITLVSAILASSAAMAQTTIIQSNTGIGCSSVCINGNCTSTCEDGDSKAIKGNGEVVDKSYDIDDFTEIMSSDIDTKVTQGEKFEIIVTADSNLIEHVIVKKDKGTLSVKLKNGQYMGATLSVQITMPDLHRLSQHGAAKLTFSGFDQSDLELNVMGAGQVEGADNLVTNLVLNTQGASSLDMRSSELTNAEIHVAGSSEIQLNFPEGKGRITGEIQGVSELQYCGDPDTNVNVFGVADIQRVNCS
ncbi:MAG: GIN domain-containing protein [bacterium]